MRKELDFMEEKKNVGVGLSGTLKFLREKGMLGTKEYVGRNKDEVTEFNKPGDRVVL